MSEATEASSDEDSRLWFESDGTVLLVHLGCTSCGTAIFPPQPYGCLRCGAEGASLERRATAARGVVVDGVEVHVNAEATVPYRVGRIRLESVDLTVDARVDDEVRAADHVVAVMEQEKLVFVKERKNP